jgi:S-adenosylmethionine decarboxylase
VGLQRGQGFLSGDPWLMDGGTHVIMDLITKPRGKSRLWLYDMELVKDVFKVAAEIGRAKVFGQRWKSFGDKAGYTGVLLLSESHMSIHTFPEKNFAAIDIFMCGDADPRTAAQYILKKLPHVYGASTPIPRNTDELMSRVRRNTFGGVPL